MDVQHMISISSLAHTEFVSNLRLTSSNLETKISETKPIDKSDISRWLLQYFFTDILEKISDDQQGLQKLVKEYFNLMTLQRRSDVDNDRIINIFELAQYDTELSEKLQEIDLLIEKVFATESNHLDLDSNSQNIINLENFLYQVKKTLPENMTLSIFKNLVAKIHINADLLNIHVVSPQEDHHREIIHNSPLLSISVITWQTGGHIPKHKHENSLSVIRVCKGVLTTWKNFQTSDKDGRISSHREPRKYGKDELIGIDYFQEHELANQDVEQLITLHFRFYRSFQKEDRCQGNENSQKFRTCQYSSGY